MLYYRHWKIPALNYLMKKIPLQQCYEYADSDSCRQITADSDVITCCVQPAETNTIQDCYHWT